MCHDATTIWHIPIRRDDESPQGNSSKLCTSCYRKPSTSDTTDTNGHVYYNTTSVAETGRNIPTCGIGEEPIPAEYEEISPTSKHNLTADSLNDYEVLAGVVVGDNNVAYTTLNRE